MSWELSNEYSCDGKKVFLTWKQAQTHNHKMGRRGSPIRANGKKIEKMHVYQCKKCKKYHIGHASRGRQRQSPYSRQATRSQASRRSE